MKISLFVFALLLFSCKSNDDKKVQNKTIHVAVAANMQFVMDSIAIMFQKEYNVECLVSSNSSGMLTAQIKNGAPFDVFVAANMQYPNQLVKDGFGEVPEVYAYGSLELVYSKEDNYSSIEEVLSSEKVNRVAVANINTAPYGIATHEYLNNTGVLKKYQDKIIYCESVNQVNQYITTEAVDAGFTSNSFLTKFGKDYNAIHVNPQEYSEIRQGVLLLKNGKEQHLEVSEIFIAFLKSERGKEILQHFGYLVKP